MTAKLFSRFILLVALTLQAAPTRAAELPHRIVSANLCSDQLLLALADPGQIAALSPYARDPAMSHLAARATAFPVNRGSGEDIVRLAADLVLVGPYDNRYTRALLAEQKLDFQSLEPWTSLRDGEAQIRQLAARVGHPERGAALIDEIERALKALDGLAQRAGRPAVLVLHRRGFVFHAGVTGELLDRAGFRNAASDVGVSDAGFVTLEAILKARPDYLIVSDLDAGAEDQGQAFLQHPALARLYPAARRLVLPDRLTLCGGPSTPDLIRTLVREIGAKVLASKP